ncbi:zinc-binding dehydrogenase [Streptosporangium lutulentum]|uniref:Threonine dehydrogenase-like Zn-dependent dehydrogenase n=1 Tax=Streptosporangium lutulentum TaxID=1461250 RepID=A0ABT9QF02_9ACTN|nr:alcohol dehydrogenase catalytic domain-containing protein [Streptosporangium lutulentum]MDP9844955.1 threonine dehydrogenase-like Zn-dependent dehydrogenase [Streptosporangium lutulentum]
MRAALYLSAGNVVVDDVPDASLSQPTDAVVRVLRSCVCGSDLWSYRGIINRVERSRLGHEFIGVVEEVGSEVGTLRPGDLVVAPFMWSDNTCPACVDGIQSSCDNGGTFGAPGTDGGQGEAVRVPQADGTLVAVPGGVSGVDESLYAALLSASDVMATGLHGAVLAGVTEGSTVAVIGDGAVGLCAVLGAKAVLGAERIILMSRHADRAAIGRSFGATDVIAERGDEGIAAVRERTGGLGVRHVVEAVGTPESWAMAVGMAREGGSIGAVGIPHTAPELPLFQPLIHHLSLNLGIAPARRYLPDLISRIMAGTLDPGSVFDSVIPLADVAQGYAAMSARESIKVMLN